VSRRYLEGDLDREARIESERDVIIKIIKAYGQWAKRN
jgi:hypothetical protein